LHQRGRDLHPDEPAEGRRGPEFWELTTSPLAHTTWPEHVWPADSREPRFFDRQLLLEMASLNYGMIDVDLDRRGAEIRLQLKDSQGALVYQQGVDLDSLRVRALLPKYTLVAFSARHAYLFRGNEYVRCELSSADSKALIAHPPRPIAAGWKGVFSDSPEPSPWIDAVLALPSGKAYFFKGNGYVRYDIATDQADAGYPKYIGRHFAGVWPDGVDAAAAWRDGKAYFFRGSQCIRYDIAADRADPDYPKAIGDEFPGVWPEGIDSAALWLDGKAYFLKGDQCMRYDLAQKRPDSGYPKSLSAEWPTLPSFI
jgi:hypothetical protein